MGFRKESEPQYMFIINRLILGKKKQSEISFLSTLHRTFWDSSDLSGKTPSELNTWLEAGKAHFKAQLSPDIVTTDGGCDCPPMIRPELQGNTSDLRIQSSDAVDSKVSYHTSSHNYRILLTFVLGFFKL